MLPYLVAAVLAATITWLVIRRRARLPDLDRRAVLITGCDSGFGAALARRLADRRVPVFAGCLTEDGCRRCAAATSGPLRPFVLDVTETASIEAAERYVRENMPKGAVLWAVVNNAGIAGHNAPLEFLRRDDYRRVMDVNCFGALEVARVFLSQLKRSRGRIVNVASAVGIVPPPVVTPYVASKWALRGVSEALKYEKSAWGIRVSTICPGLFTTNIVNMADYKRRLDELWGRLDPQVREEYGAGYYDQLLRQATELAPRFGQPDLSPVLDTYDHALFARWPHHTYTPGTDAKLFCFLKNWCPEFVMDYVMVHFVADKYLPQAANRSA